MNNEFNNREKAKIRVLLICSYKIIQESLKILIEDNHDMVVADCIDAWETSIPESVEINTIDTVLIYLMDGDTETVEIISKLLQAAPDLRIILVASNEDNNNQTRAIQLGAVGIVQKEQNSKMLIEAIRQTYRGETWINQQLLTKLLNNKSHKREGSKSWDVVKAELLTTREKEVVQMIGKGLKNKDIAEGLLISEATVRHHLSSIYGKLNVDDRLNLVIYAYQQGLIQLHEAEIQTQPVL